MELPTTKRQVQYWRSVLSLDKLTEDWRKKEYEEDLHNAQKPIVCAIGHSDVLNHAAKEYT
jgi:hypothetical protein